MGYFNGINVAVLVLFALLVGIKLTFVKQIYLHALVQKGKLLQSLLNGVVIPFHGLKNLFVGQKPHKRAPFLRPLTRIAKWRRGRSANPLFSFLVVIAFKAHFKDGAAVHLNVQPFGQSVGDRSAHTVQSARKCIVFVIELTARMQLCEYNFHAAHFHLGINVRGHASAVVAYGNRAVLPQLYGNFVGIAVRRLVD